MVDILIIYEHKNRELENACLIATELERRGFTTKIECIYSLKKYFIKSKVLLVPHLYNDEQVVMFCKNFWNSKRIVIDMQYEQVLRASQHNGIHNPSGQAKIAHHLAWGDAQKQTYLEHGIQASNISVVGHVGMDLMSIQFDSIFRPREEIASEFKLDQKKKWLLFISTFAYKMKTQKELEEYYGIDKSGIEGTKRSIYAQSVILDWLKNIALEFKDIEVIYRRHPSERKDPEILTISNQIGNFHCIDSYTMRQWVRISDRLYTWYSTSISDAYFGKKTCLVLRPEELPYDYELDILHGADFITNYNDFKNSVVNYENYDFPISDDIMKYYYGKDNKEEGKYSFSKIADLCENGLADFSSNTCFFEFKKSRWNMGDSSSLYVTIGEYICGLLFEISKWLNIRIPIKMQSKKFFRRVALYHNEAYRSKKAERQYRKVFRKIIN